MTETSPPAGSPPAPAAAVPELGFSGELRARLGSATSATGRDDLDLDGEADCWQATYEGGSGYGGTSLAIDWACRGAAPEVVDDFGSFGEMLAAAVLPPSLALRDDAMRALAIWIYGAAHQTCDDGTCPAPDGSFRWLIDELHARVAAPVALAPFARVWRYTPHWTAGPPTLPRSQVMQLRGADASAGLALLHDGELDLPTLNRTAAAGGTVALLAYHAHNHLSGSRTLAAAGDCDAWRLWTTAHGVAVEDRAAARSSWVYVSTGVDKLRWPSIERVACAGALVALERRGQARARELIVVAPGDGADAAPPTSGVGVMPLEDDATWSLSAIGLRVGSAVIPLAALGAALAPQAGRTSLD